MALLYGAGGIEFARAVLLGPIDPVFEESVTYSSSYSSAGAISSSGVVSCGRFGAAQGLASIDAELAKLRSDVPSDAHAYCMNPGGVACLTSSVRGAYLTQLRSALVRRMASGSNPPTGLPDLTPYVDPLKENLKSMLAGVVYDRANEDCKSRKLNPQQCACLRDAAVNALKVRISAIRVIVNDKDDDCGGYAANGNYDTGSNTLTMCSMSIMTAFDSSNHPVEPGFANLMWLMAHELGHSVDPSGANALGASPICTYSVQVPDLANAIPGRKATFHAEDRSEQLNPAPDRYMAEAYSEVKFTDCVAPHVADATPTLDVKNALAATDATETQREVAADAFAAQLLMRAQPPLAREDLIGATSALCGDLPGSGHPMGYSRVQAFATMVQNQLCPTGVKTMGAIPACKVPGGP